jgi:hypothetical protein
MLTLASGGLSTPLVTGGTLVVGVADDFGSNTYAGGTGSRWTGHYRVTRVVRSSPPF